MESLRKALSYLSTSPAFDFQLSLSGESPPGQSIAPVKEELAECIESAS